MAQADTTQTMPELTGFQRDLLYEIAAVGPSKGQVIKDGLEDYYAMEINHGRLYPNLDTLAERGLVEKEKRVSDDRSNSYELTARGESALAQRRTWESERFDG